MADQNSGCGSVQDRILVIGTGAVGGFHGGKLSQAGACVSVVCRSDYDAVLRDGIRIQSVWGDFRFRPETVLRDVADYEGYPDYLIVALKVLPEIDAARIIAPAVGPETSIVLLQNGIEIENPFVSAFPKNEVISGIAFICVSRTGRGLIHHQDYGRLTIGLYPEGASMKTQRLAQLFQTAGVPCNITEDVIQARWRKLIWNAPFNPVSVLAGGADTGAILGCPESARVVRSVMEEVAQLASAAGHPLPDSVIERNLEDTAKMTPYKTSMLLDFEAQRPMEVEAILGNAVRAGRREGVPTPHLETLYGLLSLADLNNRKKASTGADQSS